MATEYFSDNEAYISNQPLPSPAGTPYNSLSRRTSRYGSPISEPPASQAPYPPEPNDTHDAPDNSDSVSMLDPRRFTPTLHASLVSEILSLRREMDSKHKFIEDLETSFDTVRKENDALTSQLSTSTREGRAVKGQLQQLENATLSALEEIAGERDKLKEVNEDLKDKLNSAQKKLRSQEDDSNRVHDMWAHEKEAWAGEKRTLERRVHISESRLKMLLEEIAVHEKGQENDVDSDGEGLPRDSGVGPESEAGSVRSSPARRTSTRIARHSRNLSNSSFRSFGRGYRMSFMSGTGSEGHGRNNGMSLADELVFDEEEEDLDDLELDSDDFPEHEMRALRALESRQSMRQDDKAKRILGLSLDSELPNRDIFPTEPVKSESTQPSVAVPPQKLHLVFPPPRPQSMEIPEEELESEPEPEPAPKPQYVDTGVQPSPPPSPVRPATSESALTFKLYEGTASKAEVEANQRKKRVSASFGPSVVTFQAPPMPRLMTSTSTQSSDQPLSPPATPKVDTSFDDASLSPQPRLAVASIATQTEPNEHVQSAGPVEAPAQEQSKPVLPTRAPPPIPILIPSIAIHAPSSTPSSPKEPILPPGTISVATQTTDGLRSTMRTVGMQTEPIMVDRRFQKLPPHLQPSAISSKPGTPEPGQKGKITSVDTQKMDAKQAPERTAGPSARQDLMSLLEKVADQVEDRYPGNNDSGPLTRNRESIISRPFRTSSLFAGFEGPSSDEEDSDSELSADEQRQPPPMLSARNVKSGKVFNNPPTPVPEEKEPSPSPARPSEDSIRSQVSTRASMEKPVRVGKLARQPSIRRSAMVQNGTTAHMRSRSPSIGSVDTNGFLTRPPFPVPTRSSSRKPVLSKSEGSQSPTPRNSGNFAGRRPYGMKQQHQRKDSLRKVRSAAVVSRSGRPRSRSPTLPATPSTVPLSPSLPPIPSYTSDVSSSSYSYARGHRHQLSTTTTQTALTGSASVGNSVAYQASVVDAIAATMVGEWMWKYVRGRKAFGGQESPADIAKAGDEAVSTINGVRHKRWVWISPYERSVLWSNKQPMTGPALMGTKGRKLVIQSVLDVVDNTPIPRNAGTQTLFNRSILILTPARALKFTTTTPERHYMWLTALSFLAHSSSPIPDLGAAPLLPLAPPDEEPTYRPQGATLRRSHVRDSVRLAKGKAKPVAQRYQAPMEPMPEKHNFESEQALEESADPPTIPRGPLHSRKRSSTGPLAPRPTQTFRSFSHQPVPSVYSSGSSDMYSSRQPPSVPSSVYNPNSVIASTRTSEASTSTRPFFDTMGTMRMEAFIDDSLGKDPSQRVLQSSSRPKHRRRRGSQWSVNEASRAGGAYEDIMNDPFREF
ncbi:nuclear migration protein [Paraphaeosphaeria minitans]|uniref:Nuclear migration protein n=1 Tax=Paraphaeosphaeria minitans TaxID=565426 RepID=A0A9P6GCR0_9PLEO|nr:nuclear migration protein [Paraphaeosphaeria minitans]